MRKAFLKNGYKQTLKRVMCGILCFAVTLSATACAGSEDTSSRTTSRTTTTTTTTTPAPALVPETPADNADADAPTVLTVENESVSTLDNTMTLKVVIEGNKLTAAPEPENICLLGAFSAYKVTKVTKRSSTKLSIDIEAENEESLRTLDGGLLMIDGDCFEKPLDSGFAISSSAVSVCVPAVKLDINSGVFYDEGKLCFELEFENCTPAKKLDPSCIEISCEDESVTVAEAGVNEDEVYVSLNVAAADIDKAIDKVQGMTLTVSEKGTDEKVSVSTDIRFPYVSVYAEIISAPDNDNSETLLLHAVNGKFSETLSVDDITFKHDLGSVSGADLTLSENNATAQITFKTESGTDLSGTKTLLTVNEGALINMWGTPAGLKSTFVAHNGDVYTPADNDENGETESEDESADEAESDESADETESEDESTDETESETESTDEQTSDDRDTPLLGANDALTENGGDDSTSEDEDEDEEENKGSKKSAVDFKKATNMIDQIDKIADKIVKVAEYIDKTDVTKFIKFGGMAVSALGGVTAAFDAISLILTWTGAIESTDAKLDKIYDQLLDMQKQIDKLQVTVDKIKDELHRLSKDDQLNAAQQNWKDVYNSIVALQNLVNTYRSLIDGQLYKIINSGKVRVCYKVLDKSQLEQYVNEYVKQQNNGDLSSDSAKEDKETLMAYYQNYRPDGISNLADGEYLMATLQDGNDPKLSIDGLDLALDGNGEVYFDTFDIRGIEDTDGNTVLANMNRWYTSKHCYMYECDPDIAFENGCVIDIMSGIFMKLGNIDEYKENAPILASIITNQILAQAASKAANDPTFYNVVNDFKSVCSGLSDITTKNSFQSYCDYLGCLYNFPGETADIRENMVVYITNALNSGYYIAQEIMNYRLGVYSAESDLLPLRDAALARVDEVNKANDRLIDSSAGISNDDWKYSYVKKTYVSLGYTKPLVADLLYISRYEVGIDGSSMPVFSTTKNFTTYTAYTTKSHDTYMFVYKDDKGKVCVSGKGNAVAGVNADNKADENNIYGESFEADEMTDVAERCASVGVTLYDSLKNAGFSEDTLKNIGCFSAGKGCLHYSFQKDVKDKEMVRLIHSSGSAAEPEYYILTNTKGDYVYYDKRGPEYISWDTITTVSANVYGLGDTTCAASSKDIASASFTSHWWRSDEVGFNGETLNCIGFFRTM